MRITTAPLALALALALAALLLLAATPALGGCCDACLAQTDPSHTEITYDPLVHAQCAPVKGICCYGCGFSHGAVSFEDGVDFDAASGAPVAKAGTRVRFRFNDVARVTYELLRANQKKTSFVGSRSASAERDADGVFSICVTTGGSIALRGWGADPCTQVTPETTIRVDAVDGATCASTPAPAAGTVKPADGNSSSPVTTKPNQPVSSLDDANTNATAAPRGGKWDVANCNLNRGTVVTAADGTKTCECAGDWSSPPACDGFSWTKTILTIAGALATVLSIAISVRVYLKSRKEKAAAKNNDDDLDLDDRVSEEVLRIDRRSPSKLPTPGSTTASPATEHPSYTPARSPARNAGSTPTRSPGEAPPVRAVRETTL